MSFYCYFFRLFEVEEVLNKKQAYLEKRVEEQLKIIKENNSKQNKRVALAALRKKKQLDSQLEKIDGTLTTIEFQKEALENANTNAEVMKVMSYASKAMKSAHHNMDLDQVEDLMDEIKEQQQISSEIANAISSPVSFGADIDEDDLMKELEEMEQEELDKQLLETSVPVPSTTTLPEVPTSPLESSKGSAANLKKRQEEEDELAELAQWAN